MAMILVVDEIHAASCFCQVLSNAGHQVLIAHDRTSALSCVQSQLPEIIVVDWTIAGGDELAFLQDMLSGTSPPLLVISTYSRVSDRIRALQHGADDYLVKPFELDELVARVQALLRRRSFTVRSPSLLRYSDLMLNVKLHEIYRGQRRLALSPTEFTLLARLLNSPEQVLRRGELIREVWGYEVEERWNNLTVYIRELRKKLEAGGEPRIIHTVPSVGYVLRDVSPAQEPARTPDEHARQVGGSEAE
jgi:two-component system response regulator MprA